MGVWAEYTGWGKILPGFPSFSYVRPGRLDPFLLNRHGHERLADCCVPMCYDPIRHTAETCRRIDGMTSKHREDDQSQAPSRISGSTWRTSDCCHPRWHIATRIASARPTCSTVMSVPHMTGQPQSRTGQAGGRCGAIGVRAEVSTNTGKPEGRTGRASYAEGWRIAFPCVAGGGCGVRSKRRSVSWKRNPWTR